MKWVCISALLLGLLLRSSRDYQIAMELVVCLGALLAVAQGWRTVKYFWAAAFAAIAVLFNPVVPIALSGKSFLWVQAISVTTFLASVAMLKDKPLLSIPSITSRTPRSESL